MSADASPRPTCAVRCARALDASPRARRAACLLLSPCELPNLTATGRAAGTAAWSVRGPQRIQLAARASWGGAGWSWRQVLELSARPQPQRAALDARWLLSFLSARADKAKGASAASAQCVVSSEYESSYTLHGHCGNQHKPALLLSKLVLSSFILRSKRGQFAYLSPTRPHDNLTHRPQSGRVWAPDRSPLAIGASRRPGPRSSEGPMLARAVKAGRLDTKKEVGSHRGR